MHELINNLLNIQGTLCLSLELPLDACLSSLVFCPVNSSHHGPSGFSALSVLLVCPPGSRWLYHGLEALSRQCAGAVTRLTSFVSCLSRITTLQCLLSTLLKIVSSCILSNFFFRWEYKPVPVAPSCPETDSVSYHFVNKYVFPGGKEFEEGLSFHW